MKPGNAVQHVMERLQLAEQTAVEVAVTNGADSLPNRLACPVRNGARMHAARESSGPDANVNDSSACFQLSRPKQRLCCHMLLHRAPGVQSAE